MENTIDLLIRLGEAATAHFWLPVLIWTVIATLVVAIFTISRRGHAFTRFFTYEALLWSLPAGLLAALSMNPANWIFSSEPESGIAFGISLDALSWMVPMHDPATGAAINNPAFYTGIATALVIALAIITLIRLVTGYTHLRRIRNSLQPVTETEDLELFYDLADRLKPGRRVSLCESDRIHVPVTFGWVNPVIVLPPATDHSDLELILTHELIHIRRGDYLWLWSEQVIRSLFAFHPLVHVMARKLEHYREICCDAQVLTENTRLTTRGYALALVKYLQPERGLDLTAGMAKPSNIKERIRVMNQHRKTTITGRRYAGLLLGIALLAGTSLFMACSDNIQGLSDEPSGSVSSQDFDSVSTDDLLEEHRQLRNTLAVHIRENTTGTNLSAADAIAMSPEITTVAARLTAITSELHDRNALPVDMMAAMNTTGSAPGDDPDVFAMVEQMPEMIGGQMAFYEALRYPEMARRAGIEGRVVIQFIVDEDGSVVDPKVLRGIGGGADEAAIEAISQMKFNPGIQRGQPVKVRMTQPVVFRLQEPAADEAGNSR